MDILTLDFETFYSQTYSLSKITTEQYVRDPQFETIGVAVKKNDEKTVWFSGDDEETQDFLNQFDWGNSLAIAHNAVFDMAILNWRYGVRPKRIVDTLSMARALVGANTSVSLKSLAEYFGIGEKGTEVVNALGKRRADFTPEELRRYGHYCVNDVELTRTLFDALVDMGFPTDEFKLVDLTTRMFTEPVLELDATLLADHLRTVQATKEELLSKVLVDKSQLMSNPQFAELLKARGVEPPMKISPTTGKETFAFSKSDEAFKELLEHEDFLVQALVAARLGVKSTLEETRTERFIGLAGRGSFPVPLRYYGAHTGRWSGEDKINLQNLPRGSLLKKAVLAPEGYVFIDSDSSQIEARTLAWLAGQDDLVAAFNAGEDVYKIMATKIYNVALEDVTGEQRRVGKSAVLGCLAEGSLVLCERGWVPIERVTLEDRVWDGEEWVRHQGLLKQGNKETLRLSGLWLTPDHRILCGTQWKEAGSVLTDASSLSLALARGAATLPSQATCGAPETALTPFWLRALVARLSTPLTGKTSKTSNLHAATCARNGPPTPRGTGFTSALWRTTSTALGYLTGYQPPLPAAITPTTESSRIMAAEGFSSIKNGATTGPRSLSTSRPCRGGTIQRAKWTARITTKVTNRVTSVLQRAAKTLSTNAESESCRKVLPTYDLAFAGPRNRYTVATNAGPVIVHNCGYGLGWRKFKLYVKQTTGLTITDSDAEYIVQTYRETYPMIPIFWRKVDRALEAVADNERMRLGRDDLLLVDGSNGIVLPNELRLKYPNMRRKQDEESGKTGLVYDTKKGRSTIPKHIWGGAGTENICQALARIVIGEQMIRVAKRYRVVLTVHDAIGSIAPEGEAQEALDFVQECMRVRPKWAPELPLDCEAGYGASYGDC